MNELSDEVKIWNTPSIGAYLLWRFTNGYTQNHPTGDSPPGVLAFIASGILTNYELLDQVSDKRKSLQSYVRSFEENKKIDLLLGLQKNIAGKKEYTLSAIDIAIASGLLFWDKETSKLYSYGLIPPKKRGLSPRAGNIKIGNKAEVLGKWFAKHDIHTITTYLKVVL
ncbi:MAG: hypothetical protein HEEMFOPI_02025 [Holosporales bacterium]